MRPVRFSRYIEISVWLQRAAYMPPLQTNLQDCNCRYAAGKPSPPWGKVARNAPNEGDMSGSCPLISHLR